MVGGFAISGAGHDKRKLYVILSEDDKYVYLADGKYKTVTNPKKKSKKHVRIMNQTVDEALCRQIIQKQAYIDDAIKYAIKQKLNSSVEEINV